MRNSQIKGRVIGVGVGPGDPDLITLKAVKILQKADIIIYPALEKTPSLARSIAAQHVPSGIQEYCLNLPMSPDPAPARKVYDQAVIDLMPHVDAGKTLVVLCEGDPLFYGSFMYLFERFSAVMPLEDLQIIPGVSSLMACAAEKQHPLAARNDVLTVLPAPVADKVIERALAQSDAIAFMKIGRHFQRLVALLTAKGELERASYIERATLPTQKIKRLQDVSSQSAPYFSMILWHRRGRASTDISVDMIHPDANSN